MKDKKLIHELLHYLSSEREKIESTGYRIDPDLRKTHRFINEEIQDLQMMLFEREYHQFSERLEQLFESSQGFIKEENRNAV
jgi:aminoglycoside phosphotransferase family enzyme